MYKLNVNLAFSFADDAQFDQERVEKMLGTLGSIVSNPANWEKEPAREAFLGAQEMEMSITINHSIDPTIAENENVRIVTPKIPMEVRGAYSNSYMQKFEKVVNTFKDGKSAFAFVLKPKSKHEEEETE